MAAIGSTARRPRRSPAREQPREGRPVSAGAETNGGQRSRRQQGFSGSSANERDYESQILMEEVVDLVEAGQIPNSPMLERTGSGRG